VQEIVVPQDWRDRLEALAGRRRDLYLIAGIAVAVVVIGVVARGHGVGASSGTPVRSQVMATPAPTATIATSIYVHVAGAVRRPGLYQLPGGTRVAQAIEAAGGPTSRADLDLLNLAEILVDATKVEVPLRGGAVTTAPTSPPASAPAAVNLNTADQPTLETIPGVGPVTATAILQKRAELGRFDTLDQLLEVTGIGPATLEALRPYVTL
jgi:competence protein ComEA